MNPHKFSVFCIKKNKNNHNLIKKIKKIFVAKKILQISQLFFYMAMAD